MSDNESKNEPTDAKGVPLSRLVRPSWFKGDPAGDWTEDASHENGNYFCKCADCDSDFIGHKRRHTCKVCHAKNLEWWNFLTPEEQEKHREEKARFIEKYFKANT